MPAQIRSMSPFSIARCRAWKEWTSLKRWIPSSPSMHDWSRSIEDVIRRFLFKSSSVDSEKCLDREIGHQKKQHTHTRTRTRTLTRIVSRSIEKKKIASLYKLRTDAMRREKGEDSLMFMSFACLSSEQWISPRWVHEATTSHRLEVGKMLCWRKGIQASRLTDTLRFEWLIEGNVDGLGQALT